jgi:hypothetical protein
MLTLSPSLEMSSLRVMVVMEVMAELASEHLLAALEQLEELAEQEARELLEVWLEITLEQFKILRIRLSILMLREAQEEMAEQVE